MSTKGLSQVGGSFSHGQFRRFSPKHKNRRKQDPALAEHSEPSMEDEDVDDDYDKAEYEDETTLDVGTMQTSTLRHGYDSPRTTNMMSEITEERSGHDEIVYDDDLDDYHADHTHTHSTPQPKEDTIAPLKQDRHTHHSLQGINGLGASFKIKNAPQMSNHDTMESNVTITPLPDHERNLLIPDDMDGDDEYGANYNEYYDDMGYAARPPNKKKYRQSDSLIKPLSYEQVKKQKEQLTKDKHQKRYSKYEASDHEDSAVYPEDYEDELPPDGHLKTDTANTTGTFVKKEIRLSITNEIDDSVLSTNNNNNNNTLYQQLPEFVMETPVSQANNNNKELSLYFNKATKDKYNDFEMNTYSSDSGSQDADREDSENVKDKYLKDPITPAPEDLDSKYASLQKSPANTKVDGRYGDEEPFNASDGDEQEDDGLKLSPVVSQKEKPAAFPKKGKVKPPKIGTTINGSSSSSPSKKKKKKKKDKDKDKDKDKEQSKKKKKLTLKAFMAVDLKKFVRKYDGDNFDVAKAVCKHYDELTEDTDTVTIVADKGKGPNTAYWSKGDYNRVEKDCGGKYIMVYRACKHVNATVKVKQDIWESCVKGLCMDNLGHSQLIADKLDSVFGAGCHVSLASHDQYEVFCRYSDGYICEVELPSKDFVVAWRR